MAAGMEDRLSVSTVPLRPLPVPQTLFLVKLPIPFRASPCEAPLDPGLTRD